MVATYRLKPYEIDGFLKVFKSTFTGKELEVSVEEVEDETDYLLKSESNRKQLLEAVEAEENGQFFCTMTMEQLEELAK
ncbi:MAG: hypothetical protein LBS97_03725 [Treponema sp.]|jgi:antitoxin YefM|nr:hypothetical protein [Treponema sp.]